LADGEAAGQELLHVHLHVFHASRRWLGLRLPPGHVLAVKVIGRLT
jgi:hypothetical protein